MINHAKVSHNYIIPRHRKYSGQHNQCDISMAHDGKAGCNTFENRTALLQSDWLYFLWHGINVGIYGTVKYFFAVLFYSVRSPLFSRVLIRSLNARIESRESWTRAQNGRLDWVGGLRSQTPPPYPRRLCFFFSRATCVNREALNSLLLCQLFHLNDKIKESKATC